MQPRGPALFQGQNVECGFGRLLPHVVYSDGLIASSEAPCLFQPCLEHSHSASTRAFLHLPIRSDVFRRANGTDMI
jgi:hypothetical protein